MRLNKLSFSVNCHLLITPLVDMLQSTVNGFGMERPMVGIHIRRTDKVHKSMVELKTCNICHSQVGTEAAFHPVEEYMKYVEEWFRLVHNYLSRLCLQM